MLVPVLALASYGCDDLKVAHSKGGPDDPSSATDGGDDGGIDPITGGEGGTKADAHDPLATRPYYDDVQATLASKRFAGPTTGMSAHAECTPSYLVWEDFDKTLHSWRGTTKARLDYGFTGSTHHEDLFASDAFITIDRPFVFLDVYKTDAPNMLVASIPYSASYTNASNGVILLDQKIDDVDIGGTKVRRWNAGSMTTEDITGVLPTREPASSMSGDTLVIPGAKFPPYSLFIVDVAKKTSTSVTFSNGTSILQTEPTPDGLLVAYKNGAPGAALRLYKGNSDVSTARIEIAPDILAVPPYFEDPPTDGQEHAIQAPIAIWGKKLLFTTQYGIWSYDLATKALQPVQLNAGKAPGPPRFMCVMRSAGLLVYGDRDSLTNQVWAVPLAAVLP